MNQLQAVKQHLESGKGITSLQAINLYGCTRLSDKIFKLRKSGMNISSLDREAVNRYGIKVRFTEYRLVKTS
jgi:hypothetical protein